MIIENGWGTSLSKSGFQNLCILVMLENVYLLIGPPGDRLPYNVEKQSLPPIAVNKLSRNVQKFIIGTSYECIFRVMRIVSVSVA